MSNLQQSKSVLKFLHARGGVQVCPVVGRRCQDKLLRLRHTAPSRPCQPSCWLLSSGDYLDFLPASFSFGLSGLPFKPHLLSHLSCGHLHHQVHDTRHLPGIWMSSGPTTRATLSSLARWETLKSPSRDRPRKPLTFCAKCIGEQPTC